MLYSHGLYNKISLQVKGPKFGAEKKVLKSEKHRRKLDKVHVSETRLRSMFEQVE